jgi:hypothetical protein
MIYRFHAGAWGGKMTYNYWGDPILGPALAYWTRKRGARSMPRKSDVDPTEISPKLLPSLQIVEVIDGGARFRYRLVGTASVEAYGEDYTGRYPDELFSDDRLCFIQNIYRAVCKSKMPLFSYNRYHTTKNVDVYANRIYMPLSDDDVDVDYILGILRFEAGAASSCGMLGEVAKLDPTGQYLESIKIETPGTA